MAKTLAIDYGEKRTGVAISDDDGNFSFSREAILDDDQSSVIAKIKDLTEQEDVEKIIVGWPITLKGEMNEQTKKVESFLEALKKSVNPVYVLYVPNLRTFDTNFQKKKRFHVDFQEI